MLKISKLTKILQNTSVVNDKFDKSRKDFYTNILQIQTFVQIFGIFVAIFSFIVVGSTQVQYIVSPENSWYNNLLNVSAVFIPLTVMLIILIASVYIINRANDSAWKN